MSFRLRKEKHLFSGRIFRLHEQTWHGPDGRAFKRQTVIHPGAVAIAAFDDRCRLVLIRQFRPAVKQKLLEIPAGTLEPGEPPLACAKRELIEETGFAARHWRLLGAIFPAPGYTSEEIILYKAWGLSPAKGEQDADEHIHPPELFTAEQVRAAVRRGRLRDGKTLSALLLLDVGRAGGAPKRESRG